MCLIIKQRIIVRPLQYVLSLKLNSPHLRKSIFLTDSLLSACVYLQVYSESVIPRIAKAASGVTGTPYNELMNSWGVYFLGFVGKYGYDRILKVRKYFILTTSQNLSVNSKE